MLHLLLLIFVVIVFLFFLTFFFRENYYNLAREGVAAPFEGVRAHDLLS